MKNNISKIAFAMLTGVIGTGLVGLTAVVSGVNYGNYSKSARDAKRIGDLDMLESAIFQYSFNYSDYPLPSDFSSNGRINDYYRPLPTDPTTGEIYTFKKGETTVLDYAYAVGNSKNGVELQAYELSTGFESKKNIEEKAEKDRGNDDLRYEKGINIDSIDCKSKLSKGSENPFKCKQSGKETVIGMIINQDFLNGKYNSKLKSLESNFAKESNNLTLTIIGDKRCREEVCSTVQELKKAIQSEEVFSGVKIVTKDFSDYGVSDYLEEVGISNLPAIIFSTNKIEYLGLKKDEIDEMLVKLNDGQYYADIGAVYDPFNPDDYEDYDYYYDDWDYYDYYDEDYYDDEDYLEIELDDGDDGNTIKEGCYTFNTSTKTITDYDESCGKDVVIPSSIGGVTVENIGKDAFSMKWLTSVVIPSSVKKLGDYSFWRNQLTTIIIPNGVTSIGKRAFYGNQLTSVEIADSVTFIDDWAFTENKISNLKLGKGLTTIKDGVFRNNRLTSVVIPSSLKNVEGSAFFENPKGYTNHDKGYNEGDIPVKLTCNGYKANPTIASEANAVLDDSCKSKTSTNSGNVNENERLEIIE